MKSDEAVRMISAEAPLLLSKVGKAGQVTTPRREAFARTWGDLRFGLAGK